VPADLEIRVLAVDIPIVSSLVNIRSNRRVMAYTAAAIYGIAGLDGAIEGFLPGDPPFSLVPIVVVFVLFFALLAVGPRLPVWALALLGPLGVALVAYALATSPGPGDGAVLYALPVFWSTFFFGRRGAVAILACVAVGHAITLLLLPAADSYPGRWLDVMVSGCGVAIVVLVLERRNDLLMTRLAEDARTDPLTGLLNRRGFGEHAARELAHAGRDGGRSIALAIFDIDYFKLVNDRFGHVVGDRALPSRGGAGERRDHREHYRPRRGGDARARRPGAIRREACRAQPDGRVRGARGVDRRLRSDRRRTTQRASSRRSQISLTVG
jgi:hypothetical protein